MSVDTDRLNKVSAVTLERGAHSPDSRYCVMEAVAYVAGEPWSDSPECVSPVIAAFLRSWNDTMGDEDRQMLRPLIPKVIGTRSISADETTRAWLATDWLARECAPAFLRLAGLSAQAELLEQLAPLTSAESASGAQDSLDAARDAAWDAARAVAWDAAGAAARAAAGAATRDAARAAAWDAAWDAAGAAAGAAAWDAAWDAAWAVAGDAARAAAWDAAWAVAGAVAGDAARDALAPTVKVLQSSAMLLVERMIAVGTDAA